MVRAKSFRTPRGKGGRGNSLNNVSFDEGNSRSPARDEKGILKYSMLMVWDEVSRKDAKNIFAEPVPVDIIPEYAEVIKFPMDLSTIRKKIEGGKYNSLSDFADDLELMWSNCETFNEPDSVFTKTAVKLRHASKKLLDRATKEIRDARTALADGSLTEPVKESSVDLGTGIQNISKSGSLVPRIASDKRVPSNSELDSAAAATASGSTYTRPPMFLLNSESKEVSALILQNIAAASQAREKSGSAERFIPRPRLEFPDPAFKMLGSRPKQNPCRPQHGMTSVRLKDYASSVYNFTRDLGEEGDRLMYEYFSQDISDEPLENNQSRDSSSGKGPQKSFLSVLESEDETKLKAIQQMQFLTEMDYFRELVGDERIFDEIFCIDLNEIDFDSPYGVSTRDILLVLTLHKEGIDMSNLWNLLELGPFDKFIEHADLRGVRASPNGMQAPSQDPQNALQQKIPGHVNASTPTATPANGTNPQKMPSSWTSADHPTKKSKVESPPNVASDGRASAQLNVPHGNPLVGYERRNENVGLAKNITPRSSIAPSQPVNSGVSADRGAISTVAQAISRGIAGANEFKGVQSQKGFPRPPQVQPVNIQTVQKPHQRNVGQSPAESLVESRQGPDEKNAASELQPDASGQDSNSQREANAFNLEDLACDFMEESPF